MKILKTKNLLHVLSITLTVLILSTPSVFAQDNNVLIGLNSPAHGVKIKTNFPGYNGGWARGFTLANRNNTENHIQFGALGSAVGGVDQLNYGFIGKKYDETYMVFKSSGKVGIGTTTPTEKLHVAGNLYTTGSIKSKSRTYYFGDVQQLYGGNGAVLYYKSNSSNYTQLIMRDKENVNYGVLCGSGNGTNFGLLDGDGNWSYLAAKDNYTALKINSVDIMRLKADGKVGIGTTIPDTKLDVKGTIRAHSENNVFKYIEIGGDDTSPYINGHAKIEFRINNQKMMSLDDFGKLVIGDVSAPHGNDGYRLYVDRGILTEKVKVAIKSTSDWSDYVFEETYDLNSIEKVEKFIKENKHLPNVPSAKQVKETGIDVAEMDATLLRQIEELWLHLIELKKENEVLKTDISKLKK